MAERKWTPAQQNCIDARGGSVLVSAAAGSGKTSVLVERVIRRITDEKEPVDIDRLLIVTFTKAAAAEMKQRLSVRLGEFIAADPENMRLQRQQMLLPTAAISTIDGFCTAFLREHFDACGISPRFGIAEGTTATMLQNEALVETLEVFYAAGEDGFLQLCDLLNGRRDDTGVKNAVLNTYNFIQAQAFPHRWLREACTVPTDAALSDTVWGQYIRRFTAEHLGFLAQMAKKSLLPLVQMPAAAGYYNRLQGDIAVLERTALTVADATNDWDTCIRGLVSAIPDRLPSAKGIDKSYTEPIKAAWSIIRDDLRKKLLPLFGESEQQATAELLATAPKLSALCALTEAFDTRYSVKKQERQLLDFSDLEHLTLNLLCDEQTGSPTPLAKEAAAGYAEILVDEFQDTNAVQDTIFRMLNDAANACFFVGDVKQSIYGFRQAMPEIFMQKKAAFSPFDGVSYPAYITLGENFRSRREVTGAVNFVFEQLMTPAFCGIDYKDGEGLIPANTTYPAASTETEVLLFDNPFAEKEVSADILEARLIAARIRELRETGSVTEKGMLRPVKYSDICILLRSRGSHAAAIAAELNRLGIPTSTDVGTPFFTTSEIQTALALLRTVDNPLRDISLAALLLSPIGGFSADDLAAARICAKDAAEKRPSLYAAFLSAANAETVPAALRTKIQQFLHTLQRQRRLAVSMAADELLTRLLEETGMLSAAAAGNDGEQRVANLRELMRLARDFEQNSFRGLSAFVRYIDRLETEKGDLTATPSAGGGDAVAVMTIHGSKGLEFPIVFMAHLFGEFNRDASRQALLLHGTAGAALTGYDAKTMTATRTVSQNGVLTATKYTALAEELRVLYVAMTRAKEKLITVFVKKNLPARMQKLVSFLPDSDTVDTPRMLAMTSPGDWLLAAFLRHTDASYLRYMAAATNIETLPCDTPLICREYTPDALPHTAMQSQAVQAAAADPTAVAALKERLSFRYPYAALSSVPVKVAASELAHKAQDAAFVATRRPAFLSEGGLTPAERGTALHTFMQFADYTAAAENTAKEADRLYDAGFLTAPQREVLDLARIDHFFQSPLYARMCAADSVQREYAFTVPLAVTAFDSTLPNAFEKETMVVQGIADCLFEEDGALVIVDYKTDRVKDPAALAALYKQQLMIYREALSKTLDKPVKQTLLYSFHLGKTVEV